MASYYSAGFISECGDAYGEALYADVWIRLNDGVGGAPSTLIKPVATGGETVVACNPITRRREVTFGAVQAGTWQVKLTNNNSWFSGYDLRGCYAAIIGAFPTSGNSAVFAQGKITRVSYSSDATVMLEISDALSDLMSYTLTRDYRFQDTGWLSDMKPESKTAGSASYDSTYLTSLVPANFADETFIVEFTSATAYKVILENGTEVQTGTIGANLDVDNVDGWSNVLRIGTSGWDGTSGAYTSGDRFVFYTSAARASATLTPIGMIMELMDNVAGLTGYDVVAGSAYSVARYDTTNWNTIDDDYDDYSLYGINGYWAKGTPIINLIEDCLKIVHGSIYPMNTGQAALWVLNPGTELSVDLNGDPGAGRVSVLTGSMETDLRDVVTSATFKYKSLEDGEQAEFTSEDSDPFWLDARPATVDIGWEVEGGAVESAANIYVNRFRDGIVRHTLETTLAGAVAEIGKQVRFSDSVIGAAAVQSDIVEVSVDLIRNKAALVAYVDPVTLADYAVVGTSTVDGSEVVW